MARTFLLKENLLEIGIDCAFLFLIAILFELLLRTIKNEMLKVYIFSWLLSMLLIFIVVQFYHYIGPAVWTISIILVMISLIYTKRDMLVVLAFTILFLGVYIWDKLLDFDNWSMYYIVQMVGFSILFFVIGIVHKIIVDRSKKNFMQYQDIVISEEKLQLTLSSVGDGIITVDINGNVDYLNPVSEKLTGWCQEDAFGKPFKMIFNIINEYTREPLESPVKSVFKNGCTIELANHTILISKGGSELS
ncbi:MAG: PAS domain S-box protein [Acetobacterium sp.]